MVYDTLVLRLWYLARLDDLGLGPKVHRARKDNMPKHLTQDCQGCGDYPCPFSSRNDTNGRPLCWTSWRKWPEGAQGQEGEERG